MLKSRMEYGAMSAKVLTLYGRLLKDEDWRRLYDCKTAGDVYSFLRGHPGWSTAMSALPPSPTPQMLELTIDKVLFADFEKLYNFSGLADKEYFKFFIHKLEYEYILSALVERNPGEVSPRSASITEFMQAHSSVDLDALAQAKNFAAVLAAVKGSIYEKPLSEMRPDPATGMPSYWEAGVLLENTRPGNRPQFLQVTRWREQKDWATVFTSDDFGRTLRENDGIYTVDGGGVFAPVK